MADGLSSVVQEFKNAPPAGKALAITAVVVVAGLGLYAAKQATNGASSAATGASMPGIDPSSLTDTGGIPFANMPASNQASTSSTSASASNSNTLTTVNQAFTPLAKGVSGYESNGNAYFYNNGSLQGTAALGDTSNLKSAPPPKGFTPKSSGMSGYESNGYGVYYNNGSLQSVVKLPSTSGSTTGTVPVKTPAQPTPPASHPVVNPPTSFKAAKSGVSGYEAGTSTYYYNNGSLQSVGKLGDVSNLNKAPAPKGFKPLSSGVSGYEANGYAVYYNNGKVQSVSKLGSR